MSVELKLGAISAADLSLFTRGKLLCYGNYNEKTSVTGCSIDSREVESGDLFVAIPGERADGHDYIKGAIERGAVAVLAEKMPESPKSLGKNYCLILVENTVRALGDIANEYKKRLVHKSIAVTGSVGKTTTKEFIASVLSERFKVHKTVGNYNNELGLPLTLLALEPDTQIAVLEMGMSGFGEIERLSKIAEPDVGIITNIGSSHMENLGSRENICSAKMEIVLGMKSGGELVLCADEPLLFLLHRSDYNPTYVSVYNRAAEFRAVNIRYGQMKTTFDLLYNRRALTNIEVPALGLHNVYSALFAYAVGAKFGMKDEDIRRGLLKYKAVEMRQNIYNIGDITVIDDCYNASPESMRAAIDVLCELSRQKGGARKVALLGDMRELGADTRLIHEQLGVYVAQKQIDCLFTYGVAAENIAHSAIKNGLRAENVYANVDVTNPLLSGEMLLEVLQPGDILLVKASRAMTAEKIINYIKENMTRQD